MVKNIIHNAVFRIFTPIFYGVAMYILILLIFDSIQQLSDNFFSIEVILCVVITYLIFESLRMYSVLVEKRCPTNCRVTYRLLVHIGGSVGLSFFITSVIISFYFSKLVGFNSFGTELTVFNSIFVLTGVLYNMIYFSFFYLNRMNVSELEQEEILRTNIEIELNTYKNKINPDFLYDSLETLIGLSKKDVDKADQFILKLSDVYRNILSIKNTELVELHEEIKISETLVEIVNYKYDGNLKFNYAKKLNEISSKIIFGTLVVVLEDIMNRSIINKIQPLLIKLEHSNANIQISHTVQNKLVQGFSKKTELNHLKKAYLHYSENTISIDEIENERVYTIPFIRDENII